MQTELKNLYPGFISYETKLIAKLKEDCRRWERLCASAWPDNLVVVAIIEGEEYWVDTNADGQWVAGHGDDCDYIGSPCESPLEALAIIEELEKENNDKVDVE